MYLNSQKPYDLSIHGNLIFFILVTPEEQMKITIILNFHNWIRKPISSEQRFPDGCQQIISVFSSKNGEELIFFQDPVSVIPLMLFKRAKHPLFLAISNNFYPLSILVLIDIQFIWHEYGLPSIFYFYEKVFF